MTTPMLTIVQHEEREHHCRSRQANSQLAALQRQFPNVSLDTLETIRREEEARRYLTEGPDQVCERTEHIQILHGCDIHG